MKKLIGILIVTLLILTVIPAIGTMNVKIGISKEFDNIPSYRRPLCFNPNDPDFSLQWHLDNTGQSNPYSGAGIQDCDIDAPEAWEIETGSSDIIIAIIDCGVDYNHPDLADNMWINEDEIPDNELDDDNNDYVDDIHGWNFLDDNNEVKDIAGHGTGCAGVAAAVTDNGVGIAGVCWNCKIMAVIADTGFDDCPEEAVAEGIRYAADNGAGVISMSIGVYKDSDLVEDAVDYAYNKGIVLVGAAGNEGRSSKLYPAGYENVIAVGATNNTDGKMDVVRWGFIHGVSNYGDWVDIAAPGVDIYVTLPTYRVDYNDILGVSQNYDYMSGTSFSCPQVSGLAALLISKNPTLTPDQIKTIICSNVDSYNSDVYIGTGRVNAFKALTAPNIPSKPAGPSSGKVGEQRTFTTSTTDDENDQLFYRWDWGDGDVSEWMGPYESGETCEALYTWEKETTYNITVKAKDVNEGTSDWSESLPFSVPKMKDKPYLHTPFQKFFKVHPNLFPLVWQLLGL